MELEIIMGLKLINWKNYGMPVNTLRKKTFRSWYWKVTKGTLILTAYMQISFAGFLCGVWKIWCSDFENFAFRPFYYLENGVQRNNSTLVIYKVIWMCVRIVGFEGKWDRVYINYKYIYIYIVLASARELKDYRFYTRSYNYKIQYWGRGVSHVPFRPSLFAFYEWRGHEKGDKKGRKLQITSTFFSKAVRCFRKSSHFTFTTLLSVIYTILILRLWYGIQVQTRQVKLFWSCKDIEIADLGSSSTTNLI